MSRPFWRRETILTTRENQVFDHVKERWINPLYREGIGRRTGRQLQINARRDSEGFENFSDYWSDSAADSDISEVVDNGTETGRIGVEGRKKDAEVASRKLSSPLKSMQSFSSAKSSEQSKSTSQLSSDLKQQSELKNGENTQQAELIENATEQDDVDGSAEQESGHVDRTANAEDQTPIQESLNEADVTGSIISLRTSQAPNSALQVFKTKKRLSFSSNEVDAIKTKKKEAPRGKRHQSPQGKCNESSESESQPPQDADNYKDNQIQRDKSDIIKKPLRQSQRHTRSSTKSSEEDEEDYLDHTLTAASSESDTPKKAASKESTDEVDYEEPIPVSKTKQPRRSKRNKGNTELKDNQEKQSENCAREDKQTNGEKKAGEEDRQDKIKEGDPKNTEIMGIEVNLNATEQLKATLNDSTEGSNFLTLQKSPLHTLANNGSGEEELEEDSGGDDDENDFEIMEEPQAAKKRRMRIRKGVPKTTSEVQKGANNKQGRKLREKPENNESAENQISNDEFKSSEKLDQENKEAEEVQKNAQKRRRGRYSKQSAAISKTLNSRQEARDEETQNHVEENRRITRKSQREKRTSVLSQRMNGEKEEGEKQKESADEPLRKSRRKVIQKDAKQTEKLGEGNEVDDPEQYSETSRRKGGKINKKRQNGANKRNNRHQEETNYDNNTDINLHNKEEENKMIESAGKSQQSRKRRVQVDSKDKESMSKSSKEDVIESGPSLDEFAEKNVEHESPTIHNASESGKALQGGSLEVQPEDVVTEGKKVKRLKGRKSAPAKVFELVQLVEEIGSENVSPASRSFTETVDKEEEYHTSSPRKWKAVLLSPVGGKGRKRGPTFTVRENASKTKTSSDSESGGDDKEAVSVRSKPTLKDRMSESNVGGNEQLHKAVFDFNDNVSNVSDGDVSSSSDTSSSSISFETVASKRLSWQKSPSELSPIKIDQHILNKTNKLSKSKESNKRTSKTVQKRQRKSKRSSTKKVDAAIKEESEASKEEIRTQEVPSKQKTKRGMPKKRNQETEKEEEEPENDCMENQSDSMQGDLLESDTSHKSISSPDEDDRRASCVMKMGARGTTVVMVHAQNKDEETEKSSPPTSISTGPSQTPRSILRKSGRTNNGRNSKRLTLQFFEKPKRKGYLVGPEKVSGLRRTQRTRVQTLEYWRNERPLYERRKSGGFALVGVMSPPTKTPAPRKRTTKARTKKKILDCQTPSNVSMHQSPPPQAAEVANKAVTVMNPDTEEEVEVDAIVTSKMHCYVGPSGKVAEPEDPILVCKCLHQPAFSSGILKVRPFKEKGTQMVRRNTMVFFIVKGKIAVTIHTTTQILQTGDTFFVPQGNVYNIKNLRSDEAKLKFFQLKNG